MSKPTAPYCDSCRDFLLPALVSLDADPVPYVQALEH
jgi:hypothetical protein